MENNNHNIKIKIKGELFTVAYSYNKKTTFKDLLEYLGFLLPSFDICQCYEFNINNWNNNNQNIPKDSLISSYSKYLDDLFLDQKEKNCFHINDNYLKKSKEDIYLYFQDDNIQIENDMEINNQNNIGNLKIDLEKKNNTIKILENEIYNLKKEIQNLMKRNSSLEKNLEEKNKKIKDLENILIPNKKYIKPKPIDYYDIIVHFNSINEINKGWKIEMNKNISQNYKKLKNQRFTTVGVIGNCDKGKSFILSKLSNMNFPSDIYIKTEGLSFKYSKEVIFIDSPGLDSPILFSDKNVNNTNIDLFDEKLQEKMITGSFIEKYIVNNSDYIIVVIDLLSLSDQKLLRTIKELIEKEKRLFIIHNLKSFKFLEQVEDYIKNILLNSTSFKLNEGKIISTKSKDEKDPYFFYEEDKLIYHLIYANENSEAGIYYNNFAINFIKNYYYLSFNKKNFDIIETIKDEYIKLLGNYIDNTDKKISKESFDNSSPNLIKLKDEKEIILKKCNFEPNYNIFKKDNKINVRVEAPGNCYIKATLLFEGEYNIIKINGIKKQDKIPVKLEDNIFNTRKYGDFDLNIPLKIKEYPLIDERPSIRDGKGIFLLEYNLMEKIEFQQCEEEDI